MTIAELREAKHEILDNIHTLAQEPLPDLEAIKSKVDSFFAKLEEDNGEEN